MTTLQLGRFVGALALALMVCGLWPSTAQALCSATDPCCIGGRIDLCCRNPESCCDPALCDAPPNATGYCLSNKCAWRCDTGYQKCGSVCILASECCTAAECTAPANATASCAASHVCTWSCNSGYKKCGSSCIPTSSCCSAGDCGAPANATAACNGGSCSWGCNGGYKQCGSGCIPSASCCTPGDCAAPANATATCGGGTCGWQCNAGYRACGGACIPNSACCGDGECTSPPKSNGCYKPGRCAAGACVYDVNDGATCRFDSSKCRTTDDTCKAGECVAGTPKKCIQEECQEVRCNPENGNCELKTPLSGVECGKTGCTDRASICKSGVCEGAKPKDCNKDVSVCRVGVCDPSNGACALSDVPNGTPCATDDKCMVDTACMHGECKGQKKSCTPSGPCKVAACNPATGACEEQDAPAGQCAGPGPGPGPGNVDAGAPGSDSPPSSEAGCSVGVSGGGGGGVALAALAGLAGVFVRRRRARR